MFHIFFIFYNLRQVFGMNIIFLNEINGEFLNFIPSKIGHLSRSVAWKKSNGFERDCQEKYLTKTDQQILVL